MIFQRDLSFVVSVFHIIKIFVREKREIIDRGTDIFND
jgi:hypothetical protein